MSKSRLFYNPKKECINTLSGESPFALATDLKRTIIICIPAYNEATNLASIIQKSSKYASEVIVCDDGSQDGTSIVAHNAGASVIRNPVNKGYGSTINTLFHKAKSRNADIMVTLDADGQHDPDQIPDVVEPIIRGETDIVIGSRFLTATDKKKVPRYRSFGIKAITKVTCVGSYKNITDAQSGFRAYSKTALSRIDLYEEGMGVSTEILFRAKEKNLRIKEVPVTINYESMFTSTHNPVLHGIMVFTHALQFLSLRHPFLFYGFPGIILLVIASFFGNNALELFSDTRYVSTNMILITLGLAIVGVVLLATGAIVYTLVALFKGKLKEVQD